jgi:hypothetical protein
MGIRTGQRPGENGREVFREATEQVLKVSFPEPEKVNEVVIG